MPLLIRKITRSKWPSENYLEVEVDTLSADAISSCLRTSNNTLSTWEVESKDQIEEAVLALACSAQRIENVDVIFMDRDEVADFGFVIIPTPGKTVVDDLVRHHYDICNLNYKSIGGFASLILKSFHEEKHLRFTASKVKAIIRKAVEDERVNLSMLDEKIQKAL
ncbi:hypothetical protein BSK62_16915 [Paenibacillus odorifer]|uniref:hypothetical protein n=1 Tax=Paenibacillus odorifer TaxID=189426 RepID=UPI00096C1DBD|nr:hypothetical protein [Paenibacillus odorifer]OMD64651.1 hypothetical protein BSK62_16915 [Paenibacillus odorifer]